MLLLQYADSYTCEAEYPTESMLKGKFLYFFKLQGSFSEVFECI
jgi:hypothetical protein